VPHADENHYGELNSLFLSLDMADMYLGQREDLETKEPLHRASIESEPPPLPIDPFP